MSLLSRGGDGTKVQLDRHAQPRRMEVSQRFVGDISAKGIREVVMECLVVASAVSLAMLPSYSERVQSDPITNAPAAARHPGEIVGRAIPKCALIPVISAMLLGACGGGDSNASTTSTQAVPVPLQTAVANEVDSGYTANFSVSGTIDNVPVTGSGTLTDSAPVLATFNGATVIQTTETITDTVVENGTPVSATETKQIFTNPATSVEVGQINDDGSVDVITQPVPIPTSVEPGSSGVLGTGAVPGYKRTTGDRHCRGYLYRGIRHHEPRGIRHRELCW